MSRRKENIIEIMIMMGREAEAVLGGNDIYMGDPERRRRRRRQRKQKRKGY